MLKELRDYGWVPTYEPFEYSAEYECIWVHLEHTAFPRMHISIETNFTGSLSVTVTVSDDDIDRAGDSMDILIQVLSQGEFDPDEIWKTCEGVMERRKNENVSYT